jgi:hypothetical protein
LAIGLLVLLALVPEINTHYASGIQDNASTIAWKFLHNFSDWLNFNTSFPGKLIRVMVSLFSALYVNKMVADHKLMEKPGYLPAINFLLLQMLLPELNSVHTICSNLILIIVLKLMIVVYKDEKPVNSLITAGFLAGLFVMIRSEGIIYFIWLSVALLIMRSASLREWIMVLTGFILPFYLLSSLLYLTNKLEFHYIFNMHPFDFTLPSLTVFDWVRMAVLLMIPLLFFTFASGQISKLLIQGRKTFIITLLLGIVTLCLFLMDLSALNRHLGLFVLPASLLMSPLLVTTRKNLLFNLFVLLLIALSQMR